MSLKFSWPRNDQALYDALTDTWWDSNGPFAMRHWLAEARGNAVPKATRPGAILLDVGCGAGLLAPHVGDKGYFHIGVDLNTAALLKAAQRQVLVLRGDATRLPIASGTVDVVCAGEILEHVNDLEAAVRECCRVLRTGGLLIVDTIADTRIARFVAIQVAERIPGAAPPGIHDPALLVDRGRLLAICRDSGVELQLRGIRPTIGSIFSFIPGIKRRGRMVPTRSTAIVFQGWGRRSL